MNTFSIQELLTIVNTLNSYKPLLVKFRPGFSAGQHLLIAEFENGERVLLSGYSDYTKKCRILNVIFNATTDDIVVYETDNDYWKGVADDIADEVISEEGFESIHEYVDRNLVGEPLDYMLGLAKQKDNYPHSITALDLTKDFDNIIAQMAYDVLSDMVSASIAEKLN